MIEAPLCRPTLPQTLCFAQEVLSPVNSNDHPPEYVTIYDDAPDKLIVPCFRRSPSLPDSLSPLIPLCLPFPPFFLSSLLLLPRISSFRSLLS